MITYLRSIPDARTPRGIRFPAWYLLLVAVLGILSGCHHSVLTEVLGVELRRPPSDSSFRYFFHQVDVSALCAAIRDWTIAQIPGGAADLDQLVCDGKTLRGSIEPTAGGGSAFIAQVTLYSAALGVANCFSSRRLRLRRSLTATARLATPPAKTMSGRCSNSCSANSILTVC
jgi:hypothetical protein